MNNRMLSDLAQALNGSESTMAVSNVNGIRTVQLPLENLLELMAQGEGQYQPASHATDDRVEGVAAELWNGTAAVRLGARPQWHDLTEAAHAHDIEATLSTARIAVNTADQIDTVENQEELDAAGLLIGAAIKDRYGRALQLAARGWMAVGEQDPILSIQGPIKIINREPVLPVKRLGWLQGAGTPIVREYAIAS